MWINCYPVIDGQSASSRLYNQNNNTREIRIYLQPDDSSPSPEDSPFSLIQINEIRDMAYAISTNPSITTLRLIALHSGDEYRNEARELADGLILNQHITSLEFTAHEDELDVIELLLDSLPRLTTVNSRLQFNAEAMELFGGFIHDRAFNMNGRTGITNLEMPMDEIGFLAFMRPWGNPPYNRFPTSLKMMEQNRDNHLPSITSLGWPMIKQFLVSRNCPLTHLSIFSSTFEHHIALTAMSAALQQNHTLTYLALWHVEFRPQTHLRQFQGVLGDCEQIMETYNANHTIQSIELRQYQQPFQIHSIGLHFPSLSQLLEWNSNTAHRHFARSRKILEYHFGVNLDVEKFKGMSESLLCHVTNFFEYAKRNGVDVEFVNQIQRRFYFDMLYNGLLLPV